MKQFQRTKNLPGYALEGERQVHGIYPESEAKILFIGEAPGAEEEKQGEPFVGRAGDFFHWGLIQAKIYRRGCGVTNVLTVRPPANDISSPEALEAIDHQLPGFREELRWAVREKGVRIIGVLGNTPLHALDIEGKITRIRGSVYEVQIAGKKIPVVPTYHPSHLNRGARWGHSKDSGSFPIVTAIMDKATEWIEDLKKIKRIAEEGWNPPKENFNIGPDWKEVQDFIESGLDEGEPFGVDIETTGFNLDSSAIVCIGLATSSEDALCIPFLDYRGKDYWSPEDFVLVQESLERLFASGRLIFQNALFDVPMLRKVGGFSIDERRIEHDTMLLHHAINPERKANLAYIVSMYGDTPYWKGDMVDSNIPILERDQREVRIYNCRDCVVMHQIIPNLLADLKEIGTQKVYYEESLPLLGPVMEMLSTGILISESRLSEWRKFLRSEEERLDKELRSRMDLPAELNFGSPSDMRLLLYRYKDNKFRKAYNPEGVHRAKTKVYREKMAIWKMSSGMRSLYYPAGFKPRRTEGGQLQVDQKNRIAHKIAANNRLMELRRLRKKTEKHLKEEEEVTETIEWLDLFEKYAEIKKLKETYSSFKTRSDGRFYPYILIHGTATGRFSSNFQQVPKRSTHAPKLRRCFIAPEGFQILSADYSNLEVRTLAYESGDPVLIERVEKGSVHDQNAKDLFDVDESHPQWKLIRRAAKTFQFGIQYGGGDYEVHRNMLIQTPELPITMRKFREIKKRYFSTYVILGEWQEEVKKKARLERKAYTSTGRVRQLYGSPRDIEKQAVNMPGQGTAASVINRALITIHREMRKRALKSRLQMQTHDEIVVEVAKEEEAEMIELLKTEMERPFPLKGKEIVFPIEMKIGPSWGELKKVEDV